MSARPCPSEEAVLAALRSGVWPDGLRAHAASCASCAETLLVAGALAADARSVAQARPLPDPAAIWLEARIRARRLAVERATRPIAVMRRFAAAGAAAAVGVAGVSFRAELARGLSWLRPPSPDAGSMLAFVNGLVLLAACGGLLALAGYALVAFRREH